MIMRITKALLKHMAVSKREQVELLRKESAEFPHMTSHNDMVIAKRITEAAFIERELIDH